MDPSSSYAMRGLIERKDCFDIALACDTDHDRHGIVTPSAGLLPANHYQSVAIDYLFRHRPLWSPRAAIGKTVVSTQLIDRVAAGLKRELFEAPVGFKWFAQDLLDGQLGWAGEESAGAAFLRRDGSVWTTDKDGITAALLAAEITAVCGRDPGALYLEMAERLGAPVGSRVDASATAGQKVLLANLRPEDVPAIELAGERITGAINKAPGNGAAIGGIKVSTANGWFAVRPSGTENIYKIYAESFKGATHLSQILQEAQALIDTVLTEAAPTQRTNPAQDQ
jgi:phosphoglucomutase